MQEISFESNETLINCTKSKKIKSWSLSEILSSNTKGTYTTGESGLVF